MQVECISQPAATLFFVLLGSRIGAAGSSLIEQASYEGSQSPGRLSHFLRKDKSRPRRLFPSQSLTASFVMKSPLLAGVVVPGFFRFQTRSISGQNSPITLDTTPKPA